MLVRVAAGLACAGLFFLSAPGYATSEPVAPPAGSHTSSPDSDPRADDPDADPGVDGEPDDDLDADFDDGGESEDDDFFGDMDVDLEAEGVVVAPAGPPSPLSAGGFTRSALGVWTERLGDNPLGKARQSLDLWLRYRTRLVRVLLEGHAEYDFAYLVERDDHDEPTLEAYEWLVDTREAYAALRLGPAEVTIGRQIVPWGVGELISPLDVVNPRDQREFGLTDIADLRLPVLASRVGLFFGDQRFEAMVVHEAFFGHRSPPRGPYSALAGLLPEMLDDKILQFRDTPDRFTLDGQQLFARWLYAGRGIDVAVYLASVLDKQGVLRFPGPEVLDQMEIDIDVDHRRHGLIGTSGAWPRDNWVFKWELGLEVGRSVNVGSLSPPTPQLDVDEATLASGLVTATYSGIDNAMISVELGKGIFIDEPDALLFPLDAMTAAIQGNYQAFRDDLEITAVALFLGETVQYGWLLRAEARYRIRDTFKIGGGIVTYHPGDEPGPLLGLDEHDRVFLDLRWDFTLR